MRFVSLPRVFLTAILIESILTEFPQSPYMSSRAAYTSSCMRPKTHTITVTDGGARTIVRAPFSRRKHMKKRIIAAAIAGVVALGLGACSSTPDTAEEGSGFGNCEVTGEKGQYTLDVITPGVLTTKADVPSVGGWYNGDTIAETKDGADYCLLANIAHRAGLESMSLDKITFAAIAAGRAGSYDMIAENFTITPERAEVLDLSDPYYQSTIGVLVKQGSDVTAENLVSKKIGVEQGTTYLDYANAWGVTQEVSVFPSLAALQSAVASGTVDAALHDFAIAASAANASNGQLEVVGQILSDQEFGVVMPKGSKNVEVVNQILADLKADGTLDALHQKYLTEALGLDPASVALWDVR